MLPVVIAGIAVFVLHRMASEVEWGDVQSDIAGASKLNLMLAVLFTFVSFSAVSLFDVFALNVFAKGKVPHWVAALTGAAGSAISNLLGFSYLTGITVRYRVYSSLGIDAAKVAGIFALSWMGFSLALISLLSVMLAFHPKGLSSVISLNPNIESAIGLSLIGILSVFYWWLSRGSRQISFWSQKIQLPSLSLASTLTLTSVVDVLATSFVLYLLLPGDVTSSFPYFFIVFVAALGLGVLSHSPGGVGVFEATLIAGLGAGGRSDVLASMVLYRLIYTLLPFLVATTGLAIIWSRLQRGAAAQIANLTYEITKTAVPYVAAGIAMISGVVLVVSGNLPSDTGRLRVLGEILPLPLIEASHLLGSIAGVLLIVVARGLYRKLYRAWALAMALMVAGLIATLAKGLDWEEAVSLVISCMFMWLFRSAFYRVDGTSVFRLNAAWIVSVIALFGAMFWVGLFAYSHVGYQDMLWWQFALDADASRFLRASLASAVVVAAVGANSLVMSRTRPAAPQPVPETVRRLLTLSPDAEAQIALTGDKSFLVTEDGKAFIAYADSGKTWIAKGDPVGDPDAARKLIWTFREKADRIARRCAFYAVSTEFLPAYLDLGLSILKIGEVARVDLADFTLDGSARKDFRQARNKAAREGYEFAIIPPNEQSRLLPRLREVSDAWLEAKQGGEKGFTMGAFDEDYLLNFDIAVLRRSETGKIFAFSNMLQTTQRHELSLDLMRYDPAGPGFVMDALFAEIMLWGKTEGFRWFSLGAAPFSGMENQQLASLWNRIGGFVYEHGEHFYHFEGLRAFKQKFDPVWSPNYLACPSGLAVPSILYEINVLISGGIKGLIK